MQSVDQYVLMSRRIYLSIYTAQIALQDEEDDHDVVISFC